MEMIAAQVDPYLAAYLAGETEGELLPEPNAARVPTYGPNLSSIRNRQRTRELLQAMDRGVLGSFSQFFNNVLSPPASELPAIEPAAVDNPFLQALAELSVETSPSLPGPDASPAPAETSSASVPPSNANPPDTTGPVRLAGGGPSAPVVETQRPYFLLRMTESGALDILQANQPREGVFAVSQVDIRDLDLFSFTDPGETPMTLAVADYNGDNRSDVALHVPAQGLIRLFYQDDERNFAEQLRIRSSRGPSSLAAGDFDSDGSTDLAISAIGTGLTVLMYGNANHTFDRFRSFFLDTYRDYIAVASDEAGSSLLGLTFGNKGNTLHEFSGANGSEQAFEYLPALDARVENILGGERRVHVALFGKNLSINVETRTGQLWNVLSTHAVADTSIVVGDLDRNGTLDVAVAK